MLNCQVLTEKLLQIKQHLPTDNELKKLKKFDSSYYEEDGTQNYLVFQPMYRQFKRLDNSDDHIGYWQSKGMSDEKNYFYCSV